MKNSNKEVGLQHYLIFHTLYILLAKDLMPELNGRLNSKLKHPFTTATIANIKNALISIQVLDTVIYLIFFRK